MSGGRVELGIGAGWFEAEHTAYGIPFPGTGERFDRFEEQLAIVTGLWASRRQLHPRGRALPGHRLPGAAQAAAEPGTAVAADPDRGHAARSARPELAARYADEFNLPFVDEETTAAQFRPGPGGLRGARSATPRR